MFLNTRCLKEKRWVLVFMNDGMPPLLVLWAALWCNEKRSESTATRPDIILWYIFRSKFSLLSIRVDQQFSLIRSEMQILTKIDFSEGNLGSVNYLYVMPTWVVPSWSSQLRKSVVPLNCDWFTKSPHWSCDIWHQNQFPERKILQFIVTKQVKDTMFEK